jgi:hypothetical protein
MHIGDYITKTVSTPETTYTDKAGTSVTQAAATYSNVKWLVGSFSYFINNSMIRGVHHVLMIPWVPLGGDSFKWNPTDDTTGGYLGSDMWRIQMPIWAGAIKTAFGANHVLKHVEFLTNATSNTIASAAGNARMGATTSYVSTEVEVNIPNEAMISGATTFSSSYNDNLACLSQLPLFAFQQRFAPTVSDGSVSWSWTRSVCDKQLVVRCDGQHGKNLEMYYIDSSSSGSVRPYFLLV